MYRNKIMWACMALVAAIVPACVTAPASRFAGMATGRSANLMFNPEWTGLAPYAIARRPWPTSSEAVAAVDARDYSIQFYETQYTLPGEHNTFYRRVNDVRRGSTGRR